MFNADEHYKGGEVQAGAAWLDETFGPDWVLDIDLSRLQLNSACDCILGQQFGDYYYTFIYSPDGNREVNVNKLEPDEAQLVAPYFEWACSRGFVLDSEELEVVETVDDPREQHPWYNYHRLTETWEALIKDRLDAGIVLP